MSELTLWGLVFGLVMVGAYLSRAFHLKKKADLTEGAGIYISAVGLAAAIRLIGFALSGSFNRLVKTTHEENWWSASSEDVAFIVLGGVALAWVSVDVIWKSFQKLKD